MKIIYEDNHLLAVNKEAGEIVQPDKTGDDSLIEIIKKWIINRDKKPGDIFLVPVHRLDRPVSGVVLFARTSKALARMNQLFSEQKVKKSYWAITAQIPEPQDGQIVSWLKKNESKNMSYLVNEGTKEAKRAVLDYRLLAASDRYALLEIDLQTGRHHQIRVQLASIGCPIRGDLKYGYPRSNSDGSISLHSRSIEFIHPVKKEPLRIVAEPQTKDNLWRYFHGVVKEE